MGCAAAPARKGKLVLVGRVIDGDTIVIAGGERVRYIGIGAPAVGTDGEEAASLNRDLVEHRYVRLLSEVTDRDTFGRLLRYVMVDGVLVEAKLVREGLWPVPVDYHPGQPHAACVAPLEEEARSLGRGIWRSSR
jgi:micrococcal nuclease